MHIIKLLLILSQSIRAQLAWLCQYMQPSQYVGPHERVWID